LWPENNLNQYTGNGLPWQCQNPSLFMGGNSTDTISLEAFAGYSNGLPDTQFLDVPKLRRLFIEFIFFRYYINPEKICHTAGIRPYKNQRPCCHTPSLLVVADHNTLATIDQCLIIGIH
jgi:hypothetical protein